MTPLSLSGRGRFVALALTSAAWAVLSDFGYLHGGALAALAALVTGLLLLAVAVAPTTWVPFLWLLLLLPVKDLHRAGGEAPGPGWAFWTDGLGASATALTAALLVWSWLRLRPTGAERVDLVWWAYFLLFVPIWAAVFSSGVDPGWALTDFKVPLFLGLAVLFFWEMLRRSGTEYGRLLGLAALAMLAGRHLVDLAYFLAGVPVTMLGPVNRVSVDSAKGLVVVLVVVSLYLAVRKGRVVRGYVPALALTLLLVAYQTRFLVVTLLLALAVFVVMLPVRPALRAAFTVVLLGGTTAVGFGLLFPDAARVQLGRWAALAADARGLAPAMLEDTRGTQIVNSQRTLWERGAYLTGMGYGASYEDSFRRFSSLDRSAFPEEEIRTGRFFRIHDMVFHVWFKFGLAGLALYGWLFVAPSLAVRRGRGGSAAEGGSRPFAEELADVVLVSAVPVVVLNLFWTTKGLILSGLLVALLRARANRGLPPAPRPAR